MKRRKAIGYILAAGTGSVLAFSGYKWYDWNKRPDDGFIEEHKDLIAALAETLIPRTDTPGAIDAGVPDFILVMLKDCTDRKSKNKFIDGLKELKQRAIQHYGKEYQNCTEQQRHELLSYFEKAGKPWPGILGKAQDRFLGRSFFLTLKHFTVEGYGTSRPGATQGLAYLSVPGAYHGCIPYQAGQKAWASK